MKHFVAILGWLGLLFAFVPTLHAKTIHVPADSTTIQKGINGASGGDTVLVAPGTYYENLTIGKEIVVKCSTMTDRPTVDGGGGGSCLAFSNSVSNDCLFCGFVLTNAVTGADCTNGRPLIDSCIFSALASFHITKAHPQEVGYYAANNEFVLHISGQFNALYIRQGIISDSTVWPLLPDGMVYYLTEEATDYAVRIEGASHPELLIETGNIVKLYEPTSAGGQDRERYLMVGLSSPGRLTALGVYFTAVTDDDLGGDSNGDGYSPPTSPYWSSIYFGSQASGSVLDSCFIRYGGAGHYLYTKQAAVYIEGSNCTVSRCEFEGNRTSIRVEGSNPIITDNSVLGCTAYGMWLDIPIINHNCSGNVISNGSYFQARLDPMAVEQFVYNNTFNLNFSGQFNAVYVEEGYITSSTVWPLLPDGMVYYLTEEATDYAVRIEGASNPELLIETGNIVKLYEPTSAGGQDRERYLMVGRSNPGRLTAHGVYFTAVTDDDLGGDSNGDGYSPPTSPYWSSIYFDIQAGGSVLDSCFIRYGGAGHYLYTKQAAVYVEGSNVTVSRCEFESNKTAVRVRAAIPIIEWSTFTNNDKGILTENNALPSIDNNSFENNAVYAVENTTTSVHVDATNNWWGDNSGPYDTSTGPPDYNPDGTGDPVSDYVIYRPWTEQPPFCQDFEGIFCDDFEDGVITEWQALTGACTWSEANGILTTSNTGTEQWCILTVGDQSWNNYVLEAKVRGISGVDKVLVFRVQDANNYYAVNLRSDYPSPGIDQLTFDKMVNGVYNADIVTADYASENGVWYHLRVTCNAETFTVFVDDSQVLQHTDTDNIYYSGGIGLACWTGLEGNCDISFDNVAVTNPFPAIVIDDATGNNVGDYITITGHLEAWDGSVFTPLSPGTIGCDDPVSEMCRIVTVDENGSFSVTTNRQVAYPAMYDFKFGASYEGAYVYQHEFVPVSPDQQPDDPSIETGLSIGVGTTKSYPQTNGTVSVQFPLVTSWEMFQGTAVSFYDLAKTCWQKATGSPTGKVITGFRNWSFDKCSWDPRTWNYCHVGANLYGLQLLQATEPYTVFSAAFSKVWNDLEANDYLTEQDVAWLTSGIDFAGLVYGVYGWTETKELIGGLKAANKFINYSITNRGVLQKNTNPHDGTILNLLVQTQDENGNIYTFMVFPKIQNFSRVSSWSPVDLVITSPVGLTVSKTVNEMPGAEYIEYDFDGDGELEDQVLLPDTVFGNYQIQVVPDGTALPTDSFSLYVENSYWTNRIVLAENELIANIPPTPYTFSTFSNLPPDSFNILAPNDTAFYDSVSIPFAWESTSDPNPDHTVFYDLIIASDSLLSDTVVLYSLTDTTYLYVDTLPSDTIDNVFFWKIRAHDLWWASTFSEQTYRFSFVPPYTCGDVDGNGSSANIGDLTYLVDYLFRGGPPPPIMDAANVNATNGINIADLTYLISYLFRGGPEPVCGPVE